MKVTIDSLSEFDSVVGFWAGARNTWDNLTDDQKDLLEDYVSEFEFNSLVEINDFIWFDAEALLY